MAQNCMCVMHRWREKDFPDMFPRFFNGKHNDLTWMTQLCIHSEMFFKLYCNEKQTKHTYCAHTHAHTSIYIKFPVLFARLLRVRGRVQEIRYMWISSTRGWEQTVYLVEEHDDLSQFKPVENADVVQCRYSQDGHSKLFPQHAASSATQASQKPCHEPPGPSMASQLTVTYVAQQGQQEEQSGSFICPAHDACHRLSVDGVRGKKQAGKQAPQASSKQQASQRGKQACHSPVEGHVNQVVTPGLQPTNSMVEAEREGTEGPVRLMAATVCE